MAFEFDGSRLPTGIEPLDRELDGGFPAGSMVAYCAPPASQSEILLYEFTATRPTLYLSTDRTEEAVRDAFARAQCPTGDPQIAQVPFDTPLQHADRLFRSIGEGMNLIVDPADELERTDRNQYRNFLNELQNHLVNTGSVAILHCMRSEYQPELRAATEHMADVVFKLYQERSGSDLETTLAVPKFRGGRSLDETIKLELADRVRVDTSRDIA